MHYGYGRTVIGLGKKYIFRTKATLASLSGEPSLINIHQYDANNVEKVIYLLGLLTALIVLNIISVALLSKFMLMIPTHSLDQNSIVLYFCTKNATIKLELFLLLFLKMLYELCCEEVKAQG
jgi:hypothetical protein